MLPETPNLVQDSYRTPLRHFLPLSLELSACYTRKRRQGLECRQGQRKHQNASNVKTPFVRTA